MTTSMFCACNTHDVFDKQPEINYDAIWRCFEYIFQLLLIDYLYYYYYKKYVFDKTLGVYPWVCP